MERRQFEHLVRKYEDMALNNPSRYWFRLYWFSFFGFALYVFTIGFAFLLLIAFVGLLIGLVIVGKGLIAIKVLLIFIVPLAIISKLMVGPLFIRNPRPEAFYLKYNECPALFDRVKEIGKQLNCGKIHDIGIMEDVNAYITQIPRFGILPFTKNYLIIGLPILLASSKDEADSIIAHEIAHISRNHSRSRQRILKFFRIWAIIHNELQSNPNRKNDRAFDFVSSFTNWYLPRFKAMTMGLSRINEFEADSDASKIMSPAVFGQDSLRILFTGNRMNDFWEKIVEDCYLMDSPPDDILLNLPSFLRQLPSIEEMKKSLERELRLGTDIYNSHPSMKDRLVNVGYPDFNQSISPLPPIAALFIPTDLPSDSPYLVYQEIEPKEIEFFASDSYIPSMEEHLLRFFSIVWKSRVRSQWNEFISSKRRTMEYEKSILSKSIHNVLSPQEKFDLAAIHYREKRLEESRSILLELSEQKDVNSNSELLLAMLNFDLNEDGLAFTHLERALKCNYHLLPKVNELKMEYFQRKGIHEHQTDLLVEIDEYYKVLNKANQERESLLPTDSFIAHDLEPEKLLKLIELIKRRNDVKKVYLIRRNFRLFPEQKGYFLFLIAKSTWYNSVSDSELGKIRDKYLEKNLVEGDLWARCSNTLPQVWKKTMQSIPNSLIFDIKVNAQ